MFYVTCKLLIRVEQLYRTCKFSVSVKLFIMVVDVIKCLGSRSAGSIVISPNFQTIKIYENHHLKYYVSTVRYIINDEMKCYIVNMKYRHKII